MIGEFTKLTLTETTPDELLQSAKLALETYFLGSSHANAIGCVSTSLQYSDQASDVTTFVKRLITALEKDQQDKTVFTTVVTSLRRFLPQGFSPTSTIGPLIASIARYFQESDPSKKLQILKETSDNLAKVTSDELGKECRKECIRLIMNPLHSMQHLDAQHLLKAVYPAHFTIEQPTMMQELVFDEAAWKQAPKLFIEFLEKRLITTHLYYDQYFTATQDAFQRYFRAPIDPDAFFAFVQSQLCIDQDPQVVHLLVAMMPRESLGNVITHYKNLFAHMPQYPIRALRLACFLQQKDLLLKPYYNHQHHLLPYSVIIDDERQVVLVSEETAQLGVYHRTAVAIRVHLTTEPRCYNVNETTYEHVGAVQVPSQVVEIARMVRATEGILEMLATCQYKKNDASPTRLSLFWQKYDKLLTQFIGCSQSEQITFALNLARGLLTLHSLKILHGSISLQAAVVKDNKALWQLQDTTCMLSQAHEPYKKMHEGCAPELVDSSSESTDVLKAELWSFGVTLFELTGKELPWKNKGSAGIKSVYEAHTNGILSHKSPYLTWVWALLNPDPSKRPILPESIALLERLLA